MAVPIIWEHVDGERVLKVYHDRQVRSGFLMPDEHPVVYRASVEPWPGDQAWFGKPGEDWRAA